MLLLMPQEGSGVEFERVMGRFSTLPGASSQCKQLNLQLHRGVIVMTFNGQGGSSRLAWQRPSDANASVSRGACRGKRNKTEPMDTVILRGASGIGAVEIIERGTFAVRSYWRLWRMRIM
jgi:hypothetical protein